MMGRRAVISRQADSSRSMRFVPHHILRSPPTSLKTFLLYETEALLLVWAQMH